VNNKQSLALEMHVGRCGLGYLETEK